MSQVITDELTAIDRAFAGNRLLSTFDQDARALLEPDSEIVELEPGKAIFKPGELLTHSIFPFSQTMIGLIVDLDDDRSVEVASIGREGAVGGIVSCGHAPAFSHASTLIGGPALRIHCRRWTMRSNGAATLAISSAATPISCSRWSCNRWHAMPSIRSASERPDGC